jgi:hypothetical protein
LQRKARKSSRRSTRNASLDIRTRHSHSTLFTSARKHETRRAIASSILTCIFAGIRGYLKKKKKKKRIRKLWRDSSRTCTAHRCSNPRCGMRMSLKHCHRLMYDPISLCKRLCEYVTMCAILVLHSLRCQCHERKKVRGDYVYVRARANNVHMHIHIIYTYYIYIYIYIYMGTRRQMAACSVFLIIKSTTY